MSSGTSDVETMRARMLRDQGITAYRKGDLQTARDLLIQALETDPSNEYAWLWLSGTLTKKSERAYCLGRVLTINPQNEAARLGVAKLSGVLPTAPEFILAARRQTGAGATLAPPGLRQPQRILGARSAPAAPETVQAPTPARRDDAAGRPPAGSASFDLIFGRAGQESETAARKDAPAEESPAPPPPPAGLAGGQARPSTTPLPEDYPPPRPATAPPAGSDEPPPPQAKIKYPPWMEKPYDLPAVAPAQGEAQPAPTPPWAQPSPTYAGAREAQPATAQATAALDARQTRQVRSFCTLCFLGFAGLALAVLIAAGVGPSAWVRPLACKAQDYSELARPILRDWRDANARARLTPRVALAEQIADLQGIRWRLSDLPAPDCAQQAHAALLVEMGQAITLYLDFLAQSPTATLEDPCEEQERCLDELRGALLRMSQSPAATLSAPIDERLGALERFEAELLQLRRSSALIYQP